MDIRIPRVPEDYADPPPSVRASVRISCFFEAARSSALRSRRA